MKHGYNIRDLILENGEHYNAKIQKILLSSLWSLLSNRTYRTIREIIVIFLTKLKKKNDQLVFAK